MLLGLLILKHIRIDYQGCLERENLPTRIAMVREKYLENEFFFQVREKSGNFVDGQGNLERTWKVREFENKWLAGSLQKIYFFCSRGERMYSLMR